jgi:hypothetical protein
MTIDHDTKQPAINRLTDELGLANDNLRLMTEDRWKSRHIGDTS